MNLSKSEEDRRSGKNRWKSRNYTNTLFIYEIVQRIKFQQMKQCF